MICKVNNLRRSQGITLVEILVSVLILTVGIVSCLLYFTTTFKSTEYARDVTVATNHAENVLEEMRSRLSLAEVREQDWGLWARDNGLKTLPQETVSVAFADPEADPLSITVHVSWARDGRPSRITLATEMTK